MIKLYRLSDDMAEYWEAWEEAPGTHTVHWGELGTRGQTKAIKSGFFRSVQSLLEKEVDQLIDQGFVVIEPEDHSALLIEYSVDEMGSQGDLTKRHALEMRMNETLGWTGLGMCDGGSIGSGTMEVCCFVVDFDLAKRVVEDDLKDTEFADFLRIYQE